MNVRATAENLDQEIVDALKDWTNTDLRRAVNEAIEEMDVLGHSFYVFLDAKTQTVQVIYRRNDGDVGLIEPIIN